MRFFIFLQGKSFAGDAGYIATDRGKFAAVAVFIAAVGGKRFGKQKQGQRIKIMD